MDTQIQEFLKAKSCIMRICEIFEIPKETDEGSLRIEEGRLLPVEFSGVSFSYNGNDLILKNISFRLEGGCKLGIIGRTGCGKSTLVQLLMRYYPRPFQRDSQRGQMGAGCGETAKLWQP